MKHRIPPWDVGVEAADLTENFCGKDEQQYYHFKLNRQRYIEFAVNDNRYVEQQQGQHAEEHRIIITVKKTSHTNRDDRHYQYRMDNGFTML